VQKINRSLSAIGVLACLLIVVGCNEQASVQLHEPGEYKGASDPLREIAGTSEQNARLEQRLRAVQTDR